MRKFAGALATGVIVAAFAIPAMADNAAAPAAANPAPAAPAAAAPAAPAAQPTAQAAPAAQPMKKPMHMAMSRKKVEAIQTALAKGGESVPIDGIWGPKTTAAVRDFQKAHNLKVTGHMDRETWKALPKNT